MLPLAASLHVAIGAGEIAHVLPASHPLQPLPMSPDWCRNAFQWHDRVLPLVDLPVLLGPATEPVPGRAIVVVAWPGTDALVHYGGLRLGGLPFARTVGDHQQCAYPDPVSRWESIASSCFEDPDCGTVPVLDLPRLFSAVPALMQ
jgi:chemotaxis signal transduction protein